MGRFAVLLIATVLAGGSVPAQQIEQALPSSVLVINQERLLTGSALGKLVAAADEAEKKQLADLGEALSQSLEAEELALTEQRQTLPPDAFRKLADAFDKKVVEIRADQDLKAEALGNAIDGRRRQFYTQVAPVLLEIMQKYGAAVILEQRSVLLSVRGINVTDEVIARIDATFKTLADIGIND